MKYPKEYLDEIKTRLKVSTVVSKSVSLKKSHADEIDFAKAGPLIKELLNNL